MRWHASWGQLLVGHRTIVFVQAQLQPRHVDMVEITLDRRTAILLLVAMVYVRTTLGFVEGARDQIDL